MNDIEQRLSKLFADATHVGPIPNHLIEQAESDLGLLFPPSYRLFLEKYGAALGSSQCREIYGLEFPVPDVNDPPFFSNVVTDTLRFPADCSPENSIAISSDGMSSSYHLICSASDREFEGHIVEWGPGEDLEAPFAKSFIDFCENFSELYKVRNM